MKLADFLKEAWTTYVALTPDAPKIHALLEGRGERIVNDHLAFRTFNLPGLSRFDLGAVFEAWGYKRAPEELDFPEKKLKASYFLHADKALPKIFISELLLEQVSKELQDWVRGFASRARIKGPESLLKTSWEPVSFADYQRFYPESEYAAWTGAAGIRTNHFTVLFNELRTFTTLSELNTFLKSKGFTLNSAGGEIKGTPAERLEQSSTMAKKVPWNFAGGKRPGEVHEVMGCYYEFARRYLVPGTGELFSGFIPKSADKIFESTSERR